jgi:hypothetical protein
MDGPAGQHIQAIGAPRLVTPPTLLCCCACAQAVLHPDAHEEGGLACNDKQLLAEMRECVRVHLGCLGVVGTPHTGRRASWGLRALQRCRGALVAHTLAVPRRLLLCRCIMQWIKSMGRQVGVCLHKQAAGARVCTTKPRCVRHWRTQHTNTCSPPPTADPEGRPQPGELLLSRAHV